MEKFTFIRKYEDRDYLYNEYVTNNRSSKDIGKELHISYKLVELWLAKFDIPIRHVYA
jgi:transposase